MVSLSELPPLILELVLIDLEFKDWLNLTLVNRYFRRLTIPLLFQRTVNSLFIYLRKSDPEVDRNRAQQLKLKYSKYIKTVFKLLPDPLFTIKDFYNVKVYNEFNHSKLFRSFLDSDFEAYRNLLQYTINLRFDSFIDLRILQNLHSLKKLCVKNLGTSGLKLNKLNCPNLTELRLSGGSLNVSVFEDIKTCFPKLTRININIKFYGTLISPPTFPTVTDIEFSIDYSTPDCIRAFFTDSNYWPNLKKYRINADDCTDLNFTASWPKLYKLHTISHFISSPEQIAGILNITYLHVRFGCCEYFELTTIFNYLMNLKTLQLKGRFYSENFPTTNKLNLNVFEVEYLYFLDDDFINFLTTLHACRSISILDVCSHYQIFNCKILDQVIFPNLLQLQVPKFPLGFKDCMKRCAPLLQ